MIRVALKKVNLDNWGVLEFIFILLDNGVRPTLIINDSGAGSDCFLILATEGDCLLVVIRIAAYRNRFSNRTYVCFDLQQPISNPHRDMNSVALL